MVKRSLAVAALLLSGCATESLTELLVVTDTDLAVPAELDTVRFVVRGPSGDEQRAEARWGEGGARPAVLGLVRRSESAGPLEIDVIGERSGVEILRRSARVSFVPGRASMLRMDLLRDCVGSTCGPGSTCGDAGCRSIDVAPSEVVDWSGDPAPLDGGAPPMDASVDATMPPVDSSTPDAPIDAPARECEPGDPCDDGVACTIDACDAAAGRCTHAASDAACDDGVACTVDACDPTAGCTSMPDDGACDDGVGCTIDACDATLGCRTTTMHEACAAGSYCDPLGDCTTAPTFTTVYTTILAARCGPCHTTSGSPGGGLAMPTQTAAYASLVGVTATCGGGANVLVIPRDSARSLLWRKVSGVDLCGDIMPRMSMVLSGAQVTTIARWIQGGALDL